MRRKKAAQSVALVPAPLVREVPPASYPAGVARALPTRLFGPSLLHLRHAGRVDIMCRIFGTRTRTREALCKKQLTKRARVAEWAYAAGHAKLALHILTAKQGFVGSNMQSTRGLYSPAGHCEGVFFAALPQCAPPEAGRPVRELVSCQIELGAFAGTMTTEDLGAQICQWTADQTLGARKGH